MAESVRWPAEWEPHAATWLAWPHNPDTWPGRLAAAESEFAGFVRALQECEPIRLLVADAPMEERARRRLAAAGADPERDIDYLHVPTDDAWIRDYGPLFVSRGGGRGGRRVAVDFRFDSWGRKYPPWDRDDAAAERAVRQLGLEWERADFVLEGGSVDGNGRGTVLTTESCLLNGNRRRDGEPLRSRELMEERLRDWLGARRVLWLGSGIDGDDTDGHVDDIARFVDPGTVVAAVCEDESDPDFAPLAENLRRLRDMRDQDGKPLSVATLPMPPPHRVGGQRCPASYANFYLANGAALVPVFGVPTDARALDALRELLPGRAVRGIPCAELVYGLGALHCLSQQEPR